MELGRLQNEVNPHLFICERVGLYHLNEHKKMLHICEHDERVNYPFNTMSLGNFDIPTVTYHFNHCSNRVFIKIWYKVMKTYMSIILACSFHIKMYVRYVLSLLNNLFQSWLFCIYNYSMIALYWTLNLMLNPVPLNSFRLLSITH